MRSGNLASCVSTSCVWTSSVPISFVSTLLASTLALAIPIAPARAADLVVDGVTCTLAEAIQSANADNANGNGCLDGSGPDVLLLDADVTLTAADIGSTHTDGGRAGLPDVTSVLTLRASLADTVERDPALGCAVEDTTAFRLLYVAGTGNLTLDGITLRNGCIAAAADVRGSGGAVLVGSGGSLTILGGELTGNRVHGGRSLGAVEVAQGGAVAILGAGSLAIEGTTLTDNHAYGGEGTNDGGSAYGGAVHSDAVSVRIEDALFSGNSVNGGHCTASSCFGGSAYGGAVRIGLATTPRILRTTFLANVARGGDAQATAGEGAGGAIALANTDGALLARLELRDNLAAGGITPIDGDGDGEGGAVHLLNDDDLLVRDSYFVGNAAESHGEAGAFGGALWGFSATGEIRRCTFAGNRAEGASGDPPASANGGAMYVFSGSWTLRNSTFSGNLARAGDHQGGGGEGGHARGGALVLATLSTLAHVTLHGNQAIAGDGPDGSGRAEAGGLALGSDTVSVTNSLLAGNTVTFAGASPVPEDCSDPFGGDLSSGGYNVVEAPDGCAFGATADQTGPGVGQGLHPLADRGCSFTLPNGSCPPTIALSTSSLALDGGSCSASGLSVDQRGVTRPQDHPQLTNLHDACDVGAFELDAGSFFTLPPCRLVDTRLAEDAPALAHLVARNFALAGSCGVPAGASALALNVTVTGAASGGHVVIWPGGAAVPSTSTLNFAAGETRANNAISSLSLDGTLDARAFLAAGSGTVHLILDVTGYFE